jgi:metal-responsive CopG/Arc/MetJ family transcriptional regulator
MRRRVNITLPEETIRLIDRAAGHGTRSRLIDEAVRYFVRGRTRTQLRNLKGEADRQRGVSRESADELMPAKW